eukprot:scaffold197170_cov14-Tisochrysis_lutea.AAC.1
MRRFLPLWRAGGACCCLSDSNCAHTHVCVNFSPDPPSQAEALTTNLDGRLQLQQVGLAHENLLGREAQHPYFILRQLHLLARPAVPHVQQPLDNLIYLWNEQARGCSKAVGGCA